MNITRTINGKDVEIKVNFKIWEATRNGRYVTGGTTEDCNDLREVIPSIIEMVEIDMDAQSGNYNDVCGECGQAISPNIDCPSCTDARYAAADFAADAREWERRVLEASQ